MSWDNERQNCICGTWEIYLRKLNISEVSSNKEIPFRILTFSRPVRRNFGLTHKQYELWDNKLLVPETDFYLLCFRKYTKRYLHQGKIIMIGPKVLNNYEFSQNFHRRQKFTHRNNIVLN